MLMKETIRAADVFLNCLQSRRAEQDSAIWSNILNPLHVLMLTTAEKTQYLIAANAAYVNADHKEL
jgi:hypothetical protein